MITEFILLNVIVCEFVKFKNSFYAGAAQVWSRWNDFQNNIKLIDLNYKLLKLVSYMRPSVSHNTAADNGL